MAGVMLPVDRFVDPGSHATVASFALLGVEGVMAFAIYALLIVMLMPDTISKLGEVIAIARRRAGNSEATA